MSTSRSARVLKVGARLALGASLALAIPAPAAAIETQQFGMEPYPLFEGDAVRRSFAVALEPGGSQTEQVRIWNKTKRPLEIRLYGAGVRVIGGQYQVASFEARTEGIGEWVIPDRPSVRLGPGDDAVIPFTIHAPPVMAHGDGLAAIVAEGDTGISSGGVDVIARLAMLVDVQQAGTGLWGVSWWVWAAVALLVLALAAAAAADRRRRRLARDGAAPAPAASRVPQPAGRP